MIINNQASLQLTAKRNRFTFHFIQNKTSGGAYDMRIPFGTFYVPFIAPRYDIGRRRLPSIVTLRLKSKRLRSQNQTLQRIPARSFHETISENFYYRRDFCRSRMSLVYLPLSLTVLQSVFLRICRSGVIVSRKRYHSSVSISLKCPYSSWLVLSSQIPNFCGTLQA